MKKLSDIEIIDSVLKGNQGDYALLIDRYKDKAFSLLKRLLGNEMDAEEALQDSFLKAYNSLAGFRRDSKFSTWFYRITYNTALTTANAKEYLLKMIDKLPIRNALVLILFYIDDMSLNEICQVMDISLVNAKVLLHRSRNSLRDLLLKHNYQEVI